MDKYNLCFKNLIYDESVVMQKLNPKISEGCQYTIGTKERFGFCKTKVKPGATKIKLEKTG